MEFKTLQKTSSSRNPPKTQKPLHPRLASVADPHIQSFNSIFSNLGLLEKAVSFIGSRVVFDGNQQSEITQNRNKLEIWIHSVQVAKPQIQSVTPLLPFECRERGITYKGKIQAKISYKVNNGPTVSEIRNLGALPIMVRSSKCNLENKSPFQLVASNEDASEFGGYFIVSGIERLIRLLIVPRRNHVTAIQRNSFTKRGPTYSAFGVAIRCVRTDMSSQTMTLHYCTDGCLNLRFSYRKSEYMVPVLLIIRALKTCSDQELVKRLIAGNEQNTFLVDRVELLIRSFASNYGTALYDEAACRGYLGSKFFVMLGSPDDDTDEDVGEFFLKHIVLVHLNTKIEKFDLLIFMIQKLYSFVAGDCAADNPDSPQHQEVLLGGHLFVNIMKEKLGDWLDGFVTQIKTDIRRFPATYMGKVFSKANLDLGQKLEYFLSTGNLVSNSGLDLQQTTGYTIIAEKLNFFRYISHFGSIHRGAFFAELKTTTVRKLLPEAWGFLCPVHTPDGSPCGLLNHLSHTCRIITAPLNVSGLRALIASMGVSQMTALGPKIVSKKVKVVGFGQDVDEELDPDAIAKKHSETIVSVQLDGAVIGWCCASVAAQVAKNLRHLKVTKQAVNGDGYVVPLDLEIGWVPPSIGGQYPGLYLFSTPARFMRPVVYLPNSEPDMVGSFEQVYLDIACVKEDVVPGLSTHIEIHPTSILSVVANLTPFSDFNQSPRNMYQCQMGKQSMGTPVHNFPNRTDNKMYRLQTGQSPIVRPNVFEEYGMDDYPNGMNAVVAVIAYTGYDMEDASILSKSSFERGYGYGTIYKSEFIDLSEKQSRSSSGTLRFGLVTPSGVTLKPSDLQKVENFIDTDGLPKVGVKLTDGDAYYAYYNDEEERINLGKFKGFEDAFVDEVRLIGNDNGDAELSKIHVKFRIPRPPIIGDKFSSRHGQKGVISQKWPTIDMPFSESGIQPDVIINPHAFPSRMTIGMFVESLAGKSGALHGRSQDATPFQFNEDHAAADFFGEELKDAGFNYHGNEPMYSGITGQEFNADIYIGVVYYQRLRHMVSDKYQVRTIGPVHNLTHQPIKGRKRFGGIRLGEMERDSLLAHGVSFILQDRLVNCSDSSVCNVCKKCGSILSPLCVSGLPGRQGSFDRGGITCGVCETGEFIDEISIPFVFRYLCAELVAMNVRIKLDII